jgi:Na+/glutamate symporter
MSQQNGFGSGFILGSIVGGVVGGLLGTVLATRNENPSSEQKNSSLQSGTEIPFGSEDSIELARHGLEDKIAQLNLAIDDVRQQLGSVKANSLEQE